MHMCICTCVREEAPGTIRSVTRQQRRRRSRLNRRPASSCPPAHTYRGVAVLMIVDALMVGLFLAAALMAQPAVATIAGTACVTVSLQIARYPRS